MPVRHGGHRTTSFALDRIALLCLVQIATYPMRYHVSRQMGQRHFLPQEAAPVLRVSHDARALQQ